MIKKHLPLTNTMLSTVLISFVEFLLSKDTSSKNLRRKIFCRKTFRRKIFRRKKFPRKIFRRKIFSRNDFRRKTFSQTKFSWWMYVVRKFSIFHSSVWIREVQFVRDQVDDYHVDLSSPWTCSSRPLDRNSTWPNFASPVFHIGVLVVEIEDEPVAQEYWLVFRRYAEFE